MKRASASMMPLIPESQGRTMGSLASPLALVTSSPDHHTGWDKDTGDTWAQGLTLQEHLVEGC